MPVKKKPQAAVAEAPRSAAKLSPEQLLDFQRQMLQIRRLEERAALAYGEQKIGGFCHLYIGQEAVAVGALAAVQPTDYVLTTYRDHGLALVRGVPAESIFAELFGREGGCSKGRGGSMHFFDRERCFLGGHGIVGAHIPLATGSAFASKYKGDGRVTLCFFGEGAVNNGAMHESFNLAALWDLPVVYICENNRYGMGTAVERACSVTDLYRKAEGYGIENGVVDGMSLFEVYEAVHRAAEDARKGRPWFLEMRTYRFRGHSMSDPVHSHYRSKEEVDKHREQDPLSLHRAYLEENGLATEAELDRMDDEVTAQIKAAMERAYQSPEPDPSTVFDHVYQDDPYRRSRQP